MDNLPLYIKENIIKYFSDDQKIYFKRKYKDCKIKLNYTYYEDEINVIELLELGCYLQLGNFDYYISSELDKYRHLIYGIYIKTINQLLILKNLTNCNIKTIYFIGNFNSKINKNNLPITIEKIVMLCEYNQPINNLPDSIKYLNVGDNFNHLVNKNNLPKFITYLNLGQHYNYDINNLPDTITYLELGYNFNSSIIKLPNSIKLLKILSKYDKYKLLNGKNIFSKKLIGINTKFDILYKCININN
jgi:hypothetical protein